MCACYRRDNCQHVNCSSLKIHLKNKPLAMYSPSHWAEISLHFMGFKNRVFLLLFLICCCIGRFLNLFFFKLSFADKVGFCRIWDSWNIAAGVLWNSACCEHWLTTLSSASSPLVSVQVNKIPLFPRMLWVRTSAGTKKHCPIFFNGAVLIYIK